MEEELAFYPALIIVASGLLADTDCRFEAGGFGTDHWAVDVAYDLSIVMEELPEVLAGLRADSPCELDLYAPGVERTLHFSAGGPVVDVECRSRTDWIPVPAVVRHDREALIRMFEKLAEDFAKAVEIGAPEVSQFDTFVRWRQGKI